MPDLTHVWVVITDDSIDNVYVFANMEDADTFAATYGYSGVAAEHPVIRRDLALEMIAERRRSNEEDA